MKEIVALASGRGTNFRAVITGLSDGRIEGARLCGLVVDRRGTGAAKIAGDAGISVHEVPYADFADRAGYDLAFARTVDALMPDLVLTLGYMRILSADFVQRHFGRLINIHPSLLPAFPGMRAQKQAFEYGVRITGCTAHYVDEGVDTGPVILQAAVPVDDSMSLQELEERILAEEHRILVEAVALFCRGAIRLEGRKVVRSGNG